MSHHSPGSHTDPTFRSQPRSTREVVRRVSKYLRPYKWMIVSTVTCAVLSLAFGFLDPQDINIALRLGWLLATCTEDSVRDGARAIEVAKAANRLTNGNNPHVLATLAAAYAEAGRFREAITTAQQGLQLAIAQQESFVAANLQLHLQTYQAGQPFRDQTQPVIHNIPPASEPSNR